MPDEFDRSAVLRWAKQHHGTEPEALWARYPGHVVLRHAENAKWYAIMMNISRSTLGLEGMGMVDILNVKCDPLLAGTLRSQSGILPAYHMNKEKWLTIVLDGSVPREEILDLLEMSFCLTAPRKA